MSETGLTARVGVAGQFQVELTRADGRCERSGWFDNRVLDNGLDLIGQSAAFTGFLSVGSGNTPVSDGQTALSAHVATASLGRDSVTREAGTWTVTVVYKATFAQGAVVGNITEVGVGAGATGANLFSRALLTDSQGAPTTIAVLATDVLTVYYRLLIRVPDQPRSGQFVLDGQQHQWTGSACDFNDRWANLEIHAAPLSLQGLTGGRAVANPAETATVGGATATYRAGHGGNGVSQALAYVPGSHQRELRFTVGTESWNFGSGGVAGVVLHGEGFGGYSFQYRFTPAVAKDNTQELSLGFTLQWGRA